MENNQEDFYYSIKPKNSVVMNKERSNRKLLVTKFQSVSINKSLNKLDKINIL